MRLTIPSLCGSTAELGRFRRTPGLPVVRNSEDIKTWRIRVGDWRVVYIIDDTARLVSITRVAHRREVYE